MDFQDYTSTREACTRNGVSETADNFYKMAFADAVRVNSAQFYGQLQVERTWENARKPYYAVWPSIVPMLTRLNLDLDSSLIQLPLPALCIRFPKEKNPLVFDWKDEEVQIRCMLVGDMGDGQAISVLIDVGEMINNGAFAIPLYSYSNFPREEGLTVEQSLAGLEKREFAEVGVQVPHDLIIDCVRLCCSLCLLENDPTVIEPDVLSKDRAKYEGSGEQKYIDKAHRRGKVGWNVGKRMEVAPHYRRPHMALVWTGTGRAVPKVVPRRGSVVHREKVEKVPSGFGGG